MEASNRALLPILVPWGKSLSGFVLMA